MGPRAGPNVLHKKKLAAVGILTELSWLLKEQKFMQNCSSKIGVSHHKHEYNIKTDLRADSSGTKSSQTPG